MPIDYTVFLIFVFTCAKKKKQSVGEYTTLISVPHSLKFHMFIIRWYCVEIINTNQHNTSTEKEEKKSNKNVGTHTVQQHFIVYSISISISRKYKTYKPISSILFCAYILFFIILYSAVLESMDSYSQYHT